RLKLSCCRLLRTEDPGQERPYRRQRAPTTRIDAETEHADGQSNAGAKTQRHNRRRGSHEERMTKDESDSEDRAAYSYRRHDRRIKVRDTDRSLAAGKPEIERNTHEQYA